MLKPDSKFGKILLCIVKIVAYSMGALIGCAMVALIILFMLSPFWLTASIGTSIIKRVSHECGKEYVIEQYYVKGNLLCASNKK